LTRFERSPEKRAVRYRGAITFTVAYPNALLYTDCDSAKVRRRRKLQAYQIYAGAGGHGPYSVDDNGSEDGNLEDKTVSGIIADIEANLGDFHRVKSLGIELVGEVPLSSA
jgi:hypothetical protein